MKMKMKMKEKMPLIPRTGYIKGWRFGWSERSSK
jgi:hypothetical protein